MAHLLLDENLPRRLLEFLTPHTGSTVQRMGWGGSRNGALLRRASDRFDVLVTLDKGIPYQLNLDGMDIAVLIVRSATNRLSDLIELAPAIAEAAHSVPAGSVVYVGSATAS
jgi:hypothetical protein